MASRQGYGYLMNDTWSTKSWEPSSQVKNSLGISGDYDRAWKRLSVHQKYVHVKSKKNHETI
jgi:hypothetical protein